MSRAVSSAEQMRDAARAPAVVPPPYEGGVEISRRRTPVPAGTEAAYEDRRWVGDLRIGLSRALGSLGWTTADNLDAALLALSELVTNELVHGMGPSINVRIAWSSDGVCFAVQNSVPEGAVRVRETGPYDEHGRGLVLIAALVDRRGTDNGWSWCTLARRRTCGNSR
ncbi:ATP-binding protein [Streptomyces lasiicapitis]|uniref:ATP-binding protein n=1 Tax=Streptomyces lasiicapitis TaxID=1923961 RepID=UPI00332A6C8C